MPYTIDTKDLQGTFMNTSLPDKQKLTAAEYAYMEPIYQQLAQRYGLDPAEMQSAKWMGTGALQYEMGKKGGMAPMERKNMTAIKNQNIAKTAVDYRISEQEAAKRWINSEIILKSLLGGIGAGILADSFTAGSEEEEAY